LAKRNAVFHERQDCRCDAANVVVALSQDGAAPRSGEPRSIMKTSLIAALEA
jgi:hypothetical protein